MKLMAAVVVLLAVAGTSPAETPDPAPDQQRVLVQFSVGTSTTLVGFKITQRAGQAVDEPADSPGRLCLKLPFNCAFVIEQADADGSGVVVRPRIGPIAFEVAVNRQSASGS
jgi:hypothetical protein